MVSTPPIGIGKIGKMGIYNSRFSVSDMSPALWLDAADTNTILDTAGAIRQWSDKSGNGFHAVQNTVIEQPTSGIRVINNLNVIDFDGVKSNMNLDYSGLFSVPSGDNTVIIVWATDASGIQQRLLSGFVSGGTRWGVLYEMLSGTITGVNANSYAPVHNSQTNDTNTHIDFMRRSGSAVEIGRDGGVNSTSDTKGSDVTVDNIRLGATLGATSAVDGKVAEILVFDRALSDFEMNRLGKYLAKKWGVNWSTI